jgi:hypothetical protein
MARARETRLSKPPLVRNAAIESLDAVRASGGRTPAPKEGTDAMSSDLSHAPMGAAGLRPLSIGELFDRAFSIYLRNVLTFAALLIVIVAPIAVIQYFMYHDAFDAYLGIIDAAVKHSSTPPDLSKLEYPISMLPLLGLNYLFVFLGLPLANAAVVSGVSRAYLGLPVRFRECYADAFRRWGYVLILTLLWSVVIVAVAAALLVVIALIAVIIGLLSVLKTFGIIVASIIGIVSFISFVLLTIVGYMVFASSFIACVLEKADPVRAFTLGFTRICGGGLLWRSVGVACSILVIGIVFAVIVNVLGGLAFWYTKAPFAFIGIAQLSNVFFIAFAFVLVALYYYDIRIRREGFDLQLLAEQLSAPPAESHTAADQAP